MSLYFADKARETEFYRTLRLIHDDLESYVRAAAPYCAINKQAENKELIDRLNKNATFWNSILAALQASTIVSLARLHDKTKDHNHLMHLIRALMKQSKDCVAAAEQLERAVKEQSLFINKILSLRNGLFAHTSIHAPLIAEWGFDGLKIDDFSSYWDAIVQSLEQCDAAIFGSAKHQPKFDAKLYSLLEEKTLKALHVKRAKRALPASGAFKSSGMGL